MLLKSPESLTTKPLLDPLKEVPEVGNVTTFELSVALTVLPTSSTLPLLALKL
jgi:hypothetical protein